MNRVRLTLVLLSVGLILALAMGQPSEGGAAQTPTARATTATPVWVRDRIASYYTLWGNRTKCGKTSQRDSWFVAALQTENMKCGMRVTICHGRRCVNVTVQDAGKDRKDNRDWDLTVRVKAALRCGDLCNVKWSKGHHA